MPEIRVYGAKILHYQLEKNDQSIDQSGSYLDCVDVVIHPLVLDSVSVDDHLFVDALVLLVLVLGVVGGGLPHLQRQLLHVQPLDAFEAGREPVVLAVKKVILLHHVAKKALGILSPRLTLHRPKKSSCYNEPGFFSRELKVETQ